MPANYTTHWECMLQGDKNAFLTIYNKYYMSLFQYGFSLTRDKELTKDCTQELFLEIWNTRSAVNKDVTDVKAYLFTWLRRKISRTISAQAKEKSLEKEMEVCDLEHASYEDLLIAFQGTQKQKEKLARAINNLTKRQIEMIKFKFFHNYSYEEIASRTSLSTRTVYNIIYEALRHLREDVTLYA